MMHIFKRSKELVLAMFLLFFVFISCKRDDDSVVEETVKEVDSTEFESEITSGTWEISSYIDAGEEETLDFDTFVFTFNTDGSLGVTDGSGSTSLSGAWRLKVAGDTSVELMVFFSSPELFIDISEDWDISNFTDTEITLEEVNDQEETTDTLIFVKI